MGQRSNDPSSTRHRTITSTTTTMKIAIVSLVLVAAVSVNGGVLTENGMTAIDTIISNIDGMSKAATDLNTMESRLEGLEAQQTQISSALTALTTNLNKENLGTNTKNNDHTNKKADGDNWVDVTQ